MKQNVQLIQIMEMLISDPVLVHGILFPQRHPQEPAEFHDTLLRDWYSSDPNVVQTVFRGGAKSTLGEEAVTILACAGLFKNMIIIGSSETRAKERLGAIKHEIENNPNIIQMFGNQMGNTWQESKIVLKNSTAIQAVGWNQSLRGVKHLAWRPDFGWIDDVEDEENVVDDLSRTKVIRRLLGVVIPAIDAPGARIRSTGTILANDSLIVQLAKLPGWTARKFPVKRRPLSLVHGDAWVSTWPARKSLEDIDKMEATYKQLGQHATFMREYMCEATSEEDRQFHESDFVPQQITRTYEATYAIYDPARTTNEATSAHTGRVVFSFAGPRIIIWESGGFFWKPDEILEDIFRVNNEYSPILIGVEQDGLHEFIMQPLRQQQLQRGTLLPLRPLKAPRAKLNFIRSLQPHFRAREVIFVPDIASHIQLKDQLLSYPGGRIDIPNALAYTLMIRPGLPMLDAFDGSVHVDQTLEYERSYPLILAINTDNSFTAAVLFQLKRGQHCILADWILEGDAGNCLGDIIKYATYEASSRFRIIAPPDHFSLYNTLGLRQAAARIPVTLVRGGEPAKGLEELRRALTTTPHGRPSLAIHEAATWSLRAMAGGWCRSADRSGHLASEPTPGPYDTLMTGLCAALALPAEALDNPDAGRRYATAADGSPYLTSRR